MNVLMQKEQLGRMLDEDPMLMEKKETLSIQQFNKAKMVF